MITQILKKLVNYLYIRLEGKHASECIKELKKFIDTTVYKGFKEPFENYDILITEDYWKENLVYKLILSCGSEELWEIDDEYENKLSDIGKKYGIKIIIPYWYYPK